MADRVELDPVLFEVIRNALVEATEEMGVTLRRSAYSTNIKTRADFSCVFADTSMRPIAQGFSQPNHLGSMAEIVPKVVRAYGKALEPGDMLVSNHPYLGGVHLNDITITAPLFDGDRLFGYVANLAHHVDVGGGAPASVGAFREVFQEGVIIPPVRVLRRGELVEDISRLILEQIRSKRETSGDFRAQFAANHTGIKRLTDLLQRHGSATVTACIDELLEYTERRTRAEIARLPKGEFAADGYLDTDGFSDEPVHLVANVVIDGDRVVFDLTGCDPQRRAPVNSTYSQTVSACEYALKCVIDPDVPANDGFYRLIRVVAPEGSVVNCTMPAPVVGGWETQTRLTDVIFKALAPVLPDAVPAGTKAMQCHAGFGGIDPRSGEYYCYLETLAGGYGGRSRSDGPDAVQAHGQNTENAPIEEIERNYPIRIRRYELVESSEGAGRHRGGLGLRRDYEFLDHEATFTVLADRDKHGPWGLFGGAAGRRAEYVLNPDTEHRVLSSKCTFEVGSGDVVSYRTCGGGGYGPALERDPALVARDVREGKVSVERAFDVYGVVLRGGTCDVDTVATAQRRHAGEGDADR
ncbi:MAG TPA: hydantoinase B/oxoprolinase family protein [Acidimicrobiales bacterium]|nr:hydantoinase B/oxoprolinase family protein [Acidimicrobiales bacterium]